MTSIVKEGFSIVSQNKVLSREVKNLTVQINLTRSLLESVDKMDQTLTEKVKDTINYTTEQLEQCETLISNHAVRKEALKGWEELATEHKHHIATGLSIPLVMCVLYVLSLSPYLLIAILAFAGVGGLYVAIGPEQIKTCAYDFIDYVHSDFIYWVEKITVVVHKIKDKVDKGKLAEICSAGENKAKSGVRELKQSLGAFSPNIALEEMQRRRQCLNFAIELLHTHIAIHVSKKSY